jgi:signal recognition particle subunit SEC65
MINENNGKKYTPTEAAKKVIYDRLYSLGYLANDEIDQQFPNATERERGLIEEQVEKIIDRIIKLVAKKMPSGWYKSY